MEDVPQRARGVAQGPLPLAAGQWQQLLETTPPAPMPGTLATSPGPLCETGPRERHAVPLATGVTTKHRGWDSRNDPGQRPRSSRRPSPTSQVSDEVLQHHLAVGLDVGAVHVGVEEDDGEGQDEDGVRVVELPHHLGVAHAVALAVGETREGAEGPQPPWAPAVGGPGNVPSPPRA